MSSLINHLQIILVLVGALLILRLAGWLGVKRLATWRAASLGAVAIMFLVTSSAHFTDMRYDLAAMIPPPLPNGLWVIYLTGIFEVVGAIGLLIPRTRRIAGIALVLLLLAMFPANVYAALNDIPLGGKPATPLWLRLPEQLLFIGIVWWVAIAKKRPAYDTDGDVMGTRALLRS